MPIPPNSQSRTGDCPRRSRIASCGWRIRMGSPGTTTRHETDQVLDCLRWTRSTTKIRNAKRGVASPREARLLPFGSHQKSNGGH